MRSEHTFVPRTQRTVRTRNPTFAATHHPLVAEHADLQRLTLGVRAPLRDGAARGQDFERDAWREMQMQLDVVVAIGHDAVSDNPVVALQKEHRATVESRGREAGVPVLGSLEIVAAHTGRPCNQGALPDVPPAESPAWDRGGLAGDGDRVVGGRGPKVVSLLPGCRICVRPRVHQHRPAPHDQREAKRIGVRMPTVQGTVRATIDEQTAGLPFPSVAHHEAATVRERTTHGRGRHFRQGVESAEPGAA